MVHALSEYLVSVVWVETVLCAWFGWASLCARPPLRFQVNLKSGTNILYWRTTGILVGGKMVKPVLLKNIQIEGKYQTPLLRYTGLSRWGFVLMLCVHTGVAYTSECFPCRPGWFSPAPGSSSCEPCPSNTFSIKDAAFCTPCPEHHYSRTYARNNSRLSNRTIRAVVLLLASLYPVINLYLLSVNVDN